MARRILGKSSPGDSDTFGSDDLDFVNALLTGTDQSSTDPVLMNTLFRIYGSKLRFRSTGAGNPDYTIVNPSGTTARNLTIPNLGQDDTVAVLTEAQTLAGKTLTTPTIASILNGSGTLNVNSSGTITVPNGTLTLATVTGTETLTNKTLTTPIITSISNSGTVTIPTGTDTLVNLAGTQTLTGKTISTASNTLTGVLTLSGTETLTNKTIAAASNTLTGVATLTGTETLTNKTLTTPVITSISNSGTITIPTATDTLMGKATTDTISNKTIDLNNSNTLIGALVSPTHKHVAWWDGGFAGNTGVGFWTGTSKLTNTTTIAGVNNSTGKYASWSAMAATTDADSGIRVSDGDGGVIRNKNCRFKAKFRLTPTGATTNFRFFCGFTNNTALLTSDDPINAKDGVLLCLRAADTDGSGTDNFQIAHNDNVGATVFDIDTGVAKDTAIHTIEIKASGDSQFQWSLDGSAFSSTNLTADIPRTTTSLFACMQIETSEAVTKTMDGFYMLVDQDV